MGMTIDSLEKECQYCYREIDNSGLEGFRCTNRTAIKARDSSWCYPKNANEPCSICEYCKPKQNTGMTREYHEGYQQGYKDAKEEGKEPTTKNDLGVDCISRAEAIKCLECDFDITGKENMKTVVNYINSAHDKIMNLPRVKQESKTGRWIWCMGSHKCSNCEEYTCFSDKELLRYCPNCGAKMAESEDTDDTNK